MQTAGYAHSQLRAYRLAPVARKKPPFRILFGAMLDGDPSLILATRGVFTASWPACPPTRLLSRVGVSAPSPVELQRYGIRGLVSLLARTWTCKPDWGRQTRAISLRHIPHSPRRTGRWKRP